MSLKDMTIARDLILADDIGTGDATLTKYVEERAASSPVTVSANATAAAEKNAQASVLKTGIDITPKLSERVKAKLDPALPSFLRSNSGCTKARLN